MNRFSNRLISFYRSAIIAISVFLFYTNILHYQFRIESSSIRPRIYIFALTALVFPFLLRMKIPRYFVASPLLYWDLAYLIILFIWFVPSGQLEMNQLVLMQRLGAAFFIMLILFILSKGNRSIDICRWTIFLCVLVAIFANIYEVFHPFSFVPLEHELSHPGRAAGFYMNANQSGAALILGLIFTVGLIPSMYRTPYALLVFVGILATLSRAAILGWFIVMFVLVIQNTLRKKEFLLGFVVFCLVGFVSIPVLLESLEVGRGIYLGNVIGRLDIFGYSGGTSIFASEDARQVLARQAWDMFLAHPIFGNGIGSTERWAEIGSSHNMYLYFMADYGIIGAIILPALVLSVTWFAKAEAKRMAIPFAAFVLFWGFFSHNIIGEYYFLISFALMAAATARVDYLSNAIPSL